MVAGTEGTPIEGVRARSSASSLATVDVFRGVLTTLHVQTPRNGEGRPVVRKRLSEPHAGDVQLQHVLQIVGHLGMRVASPHVVRTLALRGEPEGFVALDYVPGSALSELLAQSQGRDVTKFVVPVLLDVLAGLAALHALKGEGGDATPVVHQAPSARHIVVGLDGRARLCDLMHIAAPGLPASPERQRFLLPEEMSPEQASGTGHIDARCDVFIVGAVLWEALTGERLFVAPTAQETLARVLRMPIVAPSQRGTSSFFDGVCARALMRLRVGRYGSAEEMADDLREAAVPRGLCASPAEVAAWVRSCMTSSSSQSQTLLKPASGDTSLGDTHDQRSAVKATPRALHAVDLPLTEAPGTSAASRVSSPRPVLAIRADDSRDFGVYGPSLDVSDSEVFESTGPFALETADTRARPALSEQSTTDIRSTRTPLDSAESDSDSLPLLAFRADHGSDDPDREDPTRPRVISAVFGGPMPSVLSDAPAWVEDVVHGGPESERFDRQGRDAVERTRAGWLRGALLGTAVVAFLGGLTLHFGAFESVNTAQRKPTQAPRVESAPVVAGEIVREIVADESVRDDRVPNVPEPAPAPAAPAAPEIADKLAPVARHPAHRGAWYSKGAHRPSAAVRAKVRPNRDNNVPENPY